jgi:hypothetical protein
MAGEDFVEVKLTAHGEKIANGAPIAVCDGGRHFQVAPGSTLRVTRSFDWERILKDHRIDGEPLFDLVEVALVPEAIKARRNKSSDVSLASD